MPTLRITFCAHAAHLESTYIRISSIMLCSDIGAERRSALCESIDRVSILQMTSKLIHLMSQKFKSDDSLYYGSIFYKTSIHTCSNLLI